MPITSLPDVYPGDIITPAFFNRIIDALTAMQEQLDGLGPGGVGEPVITSTEPDGPRAGDAVTIHGANLAPVLDIELSEPPDAVPAGSLGGSWLLAAPTSSSGERLVAPLPASLPGLPRWMRLSVRTPAGTAATKIFVKRSDPPGAVVVQATAPDPVAPGGTHSHMVKLVGAALAGERRFSVLATVQGTPAGWQAKALFAGAPATDVKVGAGASVDVEVSYFVPSGAAPATIVVTATPLPGQEASAGSTQFTVAILVLPPSAESVKLEKVTQSMAAGRLSLDFALKPANLTTQRKLAIVVEYEDLAVGTEADWVAATRVVDAAGAPMTNEVSVVPGVDAHFGIEVDVPSGNAAVAKSAPTAAVNVVIATMTVSARSLLAGGLESNVVGVVVDVPPAATGSDSIGIVIARIWGAASGSKQPALGIAAPAGDARRVRMNVLVDHGGSYKFEAGIVGANLPNAIRDLPVSVTLTDGDSTDVDFMIALSLAELIAAGRVLRFTVTRQGTDGVGRISRSLEEPLSVFASDFIPNS